jgi:two-component system cell cycle response regulator DivK
MAKILIVEDTAANRVLATKILRSAGHEVTTAETGADGVTMARAHRPDVVLMDLGLPDMDGWQALKEIRNSEGEAARLRIVAFTAHAMVGDRERALQAGFDGYLSKPIDVATFAEKVAELVP